MKRAPLARPGPRPRGTRRKAASPRASLPSRPHPDPAAQRYVVLGRAEPAPLRDASPPPRPSPLGQGWERVRDGERLVEAARSRRAPPAQGRTLAGDDGGRPGRAVAVGPRASVASVGPRILKPKNTEASTESKEVIPVSSIVPLTEPELSVVVDAKSVPKHAPCPARRRGTDYASPPGKERHPLISHP